MVKTSKGYKGIGMNGLIAVWYTQNTGRNIKDYQRDARRIAETLPAGSTVLEVAPGPGYLSIELARLGSYRITGLDISPKFVEIAQAKAREAGVEIDFQQGDVSRMPFDDASFDLIICRAAFKNFAQPVQALNEMHRVLKPGGRALILDLRGDVSVETINQHVSEMGLSKFNALMTRWAFRFMLIKRAYTKAAFEALISQSKFETWEIQLDPISLEVCLKK